MARVCVVDDEALMRDSVAAILKRQGHTVEAFGDPRDALEAVRIIREDWTIQELKDHGEETGLKAEPELAGKEAWSASDVGVCSSGTARRS